MKKQLKNSPSGGLQSIFLVLALCFIVCISAQVSALDWDNVKSYDVLKKEVTITNALGLGDVIGTATLKTELNQRVGLGYQKVWQLETIKRDGYDLIGKMDFYNVRDGMKPISVDMDYKYLTYKKIEIPIYEQICTLNKIIEKDGNSTTCTNEITGYQTQTVEDWKNLSDGKFIDGEKVIIAGFTNVKLGDKIEWISTIYGVEIDEWTTWTADLNVGLVSYYKLDETSGTTAVDSLGLYNGTASNTRIFTAETLGIINTSGNFSQGNDYISVTGYQDPDNWDEFTISLWAINITGSSKILEFVEDAGYGCKSFTIASTGNVRGLVCDGSTIKQVDATGLSTTEYLHLVLTAKENDYVKLYVNGVLEHNVSITTFGNSGATFMIGSNSIHTSEFFTGAIDELGIWNRSLSQEEITTIYNSGDGITYIDEFGGTTSLSPDDNFISGTQTINFIGNTTYENVSNMSLIVNDTYEQINTSGLSGNYTFIETLSDGVYSWKFESCNTDGKCSNSTARTLTIDATTPTISLSYPTALIDYGKLNGTLQLNFSTTDTNLDEVWYNYNGTNITIDGALTGVYNISNITLSTKKNVTIYANDTAGNLNSSIYSWDYLFFEEGQSFNENAYETDTETFAINISTGLNILSSTGTFVYNGTNYRTTGSCVSGNCYFNKTLDLSLVTSGEYEEKDSYWNLILYNGTTSYNLTTETQTQNVTRIHLEECDGDYTTTTLNFTAYREDNLTRINPFRVAGTFDTWLGSGNIKRNQSFDKASTSNLSLCLTPTNRTQFTNAQIEYSYDDENITYVPRDYYFLNGSLTNVTQNIFLYLLEAEDSTTFIIKVQDEKLSPVVNALVYIQRYYPSDGTYKTIQIVKTDSNGETIGFYETETVDYKHIIVKDGVTLLETSPQKVVGKEVPFTLIFTVGGNFNYPWTPWIEDTNISSTLTYNETTRVITFSYIDSQEEISGGRLLVVKESLTNSTEEVICNESSTQYSAIITCNVSSYSGNLIAYGYIENSVRNIINILITSAKDMFGREGLLIGVFIIMVAGFAFIWNPSAGIIGMNASIIFVNLIGFISISPIFIFSMICISIIAIILLKT